MKVGELDLDLDVEAICHHVERQMADDVVRWMQRPEGIVLVDKPSPYMKVIMQMADITQEAVERQLAERA
jgi:hypothetical protein